MVDDIKNSRVFSIRLTFGVNPEQDEARRRFDYVWDTFAKGDRPKWIISCVNQFDFGESFVPEDKIMNLAILSQNLTAVQDGQYALTQELQHKINALETERKAIHGLLQHVSQSGQILSTQSVSDYVGNSEDVNPDLADSLLGLLDDI